jgi:hypothetical protein
MQIFHNKKIHNFCQYFYETVNEWKKLFYNMHSLLRILCDSKYDFVFKTQNMNFFLHWTSGNNEKWIKILNYEEKNAYVYTFFHDFIYEWINNN